VLHRVTNPRSAVVLGAAALEVGYAKRADRLVTRIDPGVVSQVAELRGHERQGRRGTGSVEDAPREAQGDRRLAGGDHAGHAADRRGVGLVGEGGLEMEKRGARTTNWIKCRKPLTGCAPW
jgi:hypothetical protein